MKESGKHYVDANRVSVFPISKPIAKDMIVKKHYTHSWTSCRYAIGIYYDLGEGDVFGNKQKLIGVAVYGFPVGGKAPTSVCEGLTKDNILELTRLYIDDGYGSNIESCAISKTFDWLRNNDTRIKILISYANNGQGHLGGIYKATNWRYEGHSGETSIMPRFAISLVGEPYKWIHSRSVFNIWGSNNVEHLKKVIGKQGYSEFWRVQESEKHRYTQILPKNKKEKKSILRNMKHKEYPYPTTLEAYEYPIEHHLTYEPNKSSILGFWLKKT